MLENEECGVQGVGVFLKESLVPQNYWGEEKSKYIVAVENQMLRHFTSTNNRGQLFSSTFEKK